MPESIRTSSTTSALIFEFDHLVAHVRQAAFDVLRSIFEEQDLQVVHFSRVGLQGTPIEAVERLQEKLGVKKGTARKVAEEVINGIQMHLESGMVQVTDALRNVLVAARDRDYKILGLTSLPPNPRDALSERLDLSGLGIELVPFGVKYEAYPRADAWLKVCKEQHVAAPISLALTTSMASTKAALTAGLRCIAVTDVFTDFQDFGGAHAVVGTAKEIDILSLLRGEAVPA